MHAWGSLGFRALWRTTEQRHLHGSLVMPQRKRVSTGRAQETVLALHGTQIHHRPPSALSLPHKIDRVAAPASAANLKQITSAASCYAVRFCRMISSLDHAHGVHRRRVAAL